MAGQRMLLLGARDDPIGRRIPGLRRLVQSHAVAHPSGFPPADFDGVAELWFDDLAAIECGTAVGRVAGLD